jgi:hypothetical protein
MDLSVVVLSYNVRDLTRKCLHSIHDHTVDIEYEVIVVDDNSPDASSTMVKDEFPWCRLIVNPKNLLYSAANNVGWREAMGRYVIFLNCDVEVIDDAFTRMVKFMDKHPDVDGAGCKLLNPDGSIQYCVRADPDFLSLFFQTIGWYRWFPTGLMTDRYYRTKFDYNRSQQIDHIGTTCFVIRTEAFLGCEEIWDERFPQILSDEATIYKMRLEGRKIYYIADAAVIHYGSQSLNQQSRSALIALHKEMHLYYDVYYASRHSWLTRRSAHLGIEVRKAFKLLEHSLSVDKRYIKGPGAPKSR